MSAELSGLLAVLAHFLLAVVAAIYVSANRKPSSAIAWVNTQGTPQPIHHNRRFTQRD